ncbi:unnamed protein product, partial [Ixodes pacificus]
ERREALHPALLVQHRHEDQVPEEQERLCYGVDGRPPGRAERFGTPEQREVLLHQDAARELEGQLHVVQGRLVRVPELHPGAGELSVVLVPHRSLNGQWGRPSAPWHNRSSSSGT